MTMLEKVIKGLEVCVKNPFNRDECKKLKCPYSDIFFVCIDKLHIDALDVLNAEKQKE